MPIEKMKHRKRKFEVRIKPQRPRTQKRKIYTYI